MKITNKGCFIKILFRKEIIFERSLIGAISLKYYFEKN